MPAIKSTFRWINSQRLLQVIELDEEDMLPKRTTSVTCRFMTACFSVSSSAWFIGVFGYTWMKRWCSCGIFLRLDRQGCLPLQSLKMCFQSSKVIRLEIPTITTPLSGTLHLMSYWLFHPFFRVPPRFPLVGPDLWVPTVPSGAISGDHWSLPLWTGRFRSSTQIITVTWQINQSLSPLVNRWLRCIFYIIIVLCFQVINWSKEV